MDVTLTCYNDTVKPYVDMNIYKTFQYSILNGGYNYIKGYVVQGIRILFSLLFGTWPVDFHQLTMLRKSGLLFTRVKTEINIKIITEEIEFLYLVMFIYTKWLETYRCPFTWKYVHVYVYHPYICLVKLSPEHYFILFR